MYPARPVRVTSHVPAPPTDLLAFVVDTRNDPIWCRNVETAEMLGAEPIGVGSRFRYTQHLDRGGKRLTFEGEVEITELEADRVTWRVEDRYQLREIELQVSPSGQGTTITQTTRASFKKSPGVAKWLYPIGAKRIFRSQFADLAAHFAKPASDL